MAGSRVRGRHPGKSVVLRAFTILFIAASNYFAAAPIFVQFGQTVGYLFCAVGIVLVVKMSESLGEPETDNPWREATEAGACRPRD